MTRLVEKTMFEHITKTPLGEVSVPVFAYGIEADTYEKAKELATQLFAADILNASTEQVFEADFDDFSISSWNDWTDWNEMI